MGILQKLKSLLGLDDAPSEPTPERDVGVTVERERGETLAETETEDVADAAGTPSSTGAMVDSGASEGAVEPAEATGPSDADAEPTTDESGAEPPTEGEPVDVIKGIGPAYAGRLADAGVETVPELAAADADELAAETEISAKRIRGWIERAKLR